MKHVSVSGRGETDLSALRIRFRSNSARAPKMEKVSLPPEVVVSMDSVNDLNPTPRPTSSMLSTPHIEFCEQRPSP